MATIPLKTVKKLHTNYNVDKHSLGWLNMLVKKHIKEPNPQRVEQIVALAKNLGFDGVDFSKNPPELIKGPVEY